MRELRVYLHVARQGIGEGSAARKGSAQLVRRDQLKKNRGISSSNSDKQTD